MNPGRSLTIGTNSCWTSRVTSRASLVVYVRIAVYMVHLLEASTAETERPYARRVKIATTAARSLGTSPIRSCHWRIIELIPDTVPRSTARRRDRGREAQ